MQHTATAVALPCRHKLANALAKHRAVKHANKDPRQCLANTGFLVIVLPFFVPSKLLPQIICFVQVGAKAHLNSSPLEGGGGAQFICKLTKEKK